MVSNNETTHSTTFSVEWIDAVEEWLSISKSEIISKELNDNMATFHIKFSYLSGIDRLQEYIEALMDIEQALKDAAHKLESEVELCSKLFKI